ncbi:MAG: hypothetical protein K940chlam8_00292 [Chlamydiae bacterium]|nr:hypothetical protein [Chlamydiota bacterium]
MKSSTKPPKIFPFKSIATESKKENFFTSFKKIFKRQEIPSEKPKKKQACYVHITCSDPSEDGDMEVEMTYEGNEDLVAYLVENASQFFRKN